MAKRRMTMSGDERWVMVFDAWGTPQRRRVNLHLRGIKIIPMSFRLRGRKYTWLHNYGTAQLAQGEADHIRRGWGRPGEVQNAVVREGVPSHAVSNPFMCMPSLPTWGVWLTDMDFER